MDFQTYKNSIKQIKIGKHLPDAVYLHESALGKIEPDLLSLLNKAIAFLNLEKVAWNLVKLSKREYRLSLLCYPGFFSESYPTLKVSYTINLENFSLRTTSYAKSENPPILHRKETFLLPDHPDVPKFKEITKEGERAGLYENSRTIGFQKTWNNLITQKGYALVKGRLRKLETNTESRPTSEQTVSAEKKIERHKTAIDRNSLSAPMQSLFRHDYLQGDYSLFDYGCGKGDDLNILANHNVSAKGWDPVYCPDNEIGRADIVNLGFVVNVAYSRLGKVSPEL